MRKFTTIEHLDDAMGERSLQRKYLASVFSWMCVGLILTASVAYFVAVTPSFMNLLIDDNGVTGLGYVLTFMPIGFVLLMSFGFSRLSYPILFMLFVVYAGMMGASLSFIFLIYTSQSIYLTFFVAAGMFGVMGLIGYFTKMDLTNYRIILLMGLTGVIIASVVNFFLHSDMLSYIISIVSIVVFCGLTAYDIQKLKMLSEDLRINEEDKNKMGILGALTLYLDFINLFLSLLRLFGREKHNK